MQVKEQKVLELAKNKIQFFNSLLNKASLGQKLRTRILLSDVSDYIFYYNLILNKEYKKAKNFQENLDTLSIDGISNIIYNFIDDVN